MNYTRLFRHDEPRIAGWFLALICSFLVPLAYGQDIEPNDPCGQAQVVGPVALPFVQDGELGPTPGDVDFFNFQATPGTVIQVDLEGSDSATGRLVDPYLGAFDSACNLLALNDDSGGSLNSRLVITVPDDGGFVLGVTQCCDPDFQAGGFGTYRLSLAVPQLIGSISGRIVDAESGLPLAGDAPPFVFVELRQCDSFFCSFVDFAVPNNEGRYRFPSDFFGQPLPAGTYQVAAFANQYQTAESEMFAVAEGEDFDAGDLGLQPFPIEFSEVVPCADIPAEGGRCQYSVTARNRSNKLRDGLAWSLVSSFDSTAIIGSSQFQAKKTYSLNLKPGASRSLEFDFNVPPSVGDFAFICADVQVGADPVEPGFRVIGAQFLFCIQKLPGGNFSVMSEKKANER
ncbi:MAG: hypothetical protein ACU843_11415, partial [Gammaproteobacteria bacterium]